MCYSVRLEAVEGGLHFGVAKFPFCVAACSLQSAIERPARAKQHSPTRRVIRVPPLTLALWPPEGGLIIVGTSANLSGHSLGTNPLLLAGVPIMAPAVGSGHWTRYLASKFSRTLFVRGSPGQN